MNINIQQYLQKFRVIFPDTLFELDFSTLKKERCPLCFNKVYLMQNGKGYVCRSKKHKRFYIRKEVFDRITK